VGTSAEEGYFVACDRSSMTQADIDAGRLVVLVGVAPSGQPSSSSSESRRWPALPPKPSCSPSLVAELGKPTPADATTQDESFRREFRALGVAQTTGV
jgi:hypothetical protein